MAVTLREVAKAAGYSVTTVSRALNDFSDVNEETQRHIRAVAAELGYAPNLSARQLQTRRAQALGFVIPTAPERLDEPFFLEFLSAAATEAARHDYDLLITAHAPDQGEAEAYRRLVKGQRVDGVILVRVRHDDPRITLLKELDALCVLFGRSPHPLGCAGIDVDGRAGTREVVEHLLALGHQRIAYIAGPEQYIFTTDRHQGYRDALEAADSAAAPRQNLRVEHLTEREGYRIASTLLASASPPTAIAAVTDLVAFGVMRAVREAGLRAGSDIAVVGFDGLDFSAYTNPPLTTVSQPILTIARQLVEMLLNIIDGEDVPRSVQTLKPSLVIRESSTGERAIKSATVDGTRAGGQT